MAALLATGLAVQDAGATELPRAPLGYRLGNGLAVGGVHLAGLSVAGMVVIGANCQDERHGCVYEYIFLTAFGVAPGMAMQAFGGAIGYHALRKHGYRPNPWGLYTFAVGGGLLVAGLVTSSLGPFEVGIPLALAGVPLVLVGAPGQLVTNLVQYKRRRAELSLVPMITDERRGLAVAGRW